MICEPYGYTGEWYEGYIDLLHLRARWYNAEIGAFLSRDLVESEPPYQYVRGNPVNMVDPSGLCPTFLQEHFENILTYLPLPGIQRFSLSECTVRSLRRIEKVRQGFKSQHGRVNHLKLLQWRRYLRPSG
ncbi:MAG: RHS repeat-associated core domain-containing protein [Anaerolineae bacterium]